jgi:hypothetical protein
VIHERRQPESRDAWRQIRVQENIVGRQIAVDDVFRVQVSHPKRNAEGNARLSRLIEVRRSAQPRQIRDCPIQTRLHVLSDEDAFLWDPARRSSTVRARAVIERNQMTAAGVVEAAHDFERPQNRTLQLG